LWMGFRLSRSLFSQTLLLFTMEFWLSGSPSHKLFFFHDGILAIKEPFTRTFFSHDGILAIKEPFTRTFFSHDGILAIKEPFTRTFFHDGILAIKEPFTRTFLFHDGILAIKEPFTRTFLFSRWNSGYQGTFHANFSFFTMEFTKCTIWGKTLIIYISQRVFT
jgi:hypothetical protein